VQQMPQRKQGIGACSATVISFPSKVLMTALSIGILLRHSMSSFSGRALSWLKCVIGMSPGQVGTRLSASTPCIFLVILSLLLK